MEMTLTLFDFIWLTLWFLGTFLLVRGITKPDFMSALWGTVGLLWLFIIISSR